MNLKILSDEFSVCKVKDYSLIDLTDEYCFVGKTHNENSLVCPTNKKPKNVIKAEDDWKGFYIDGILDFSLVGILSEISSLLAENKIPVFAVSTFETDFIFMKKEDFEKALRVLACAGYNVR